MDISNPHICSFCGFNKSKTGSPYIISVQAWCDTCQQRVYDLCSGNPNQAIHYCHLCKHRLLYGEDQTIAGTESNTVSNVLDLNSLEEKKEDTLPPSVDDCPPQDEKDSSTNTCNCGLIIITPEANETQKDSGPNNYNCWTVERIPEVNKTENKEVPKEAETTNEKKLVLVDENKIESKNTDELTESDKKFVFEMVMEEEKNAKEKIEPEEKTFVRRSTRIVHRTNTFTPSVSPYSIRRKKTIDVLTKI